MLAFAKSYVAKTICLDFKHGYISCVILCYAMLYIVLFLILRMLANSGLSPLEQALLPPEDSLGFDGQEVISFGGIWSHLSLVPLALG